MRAAIYARVSSEEQLAGYSIDAQLRACRERAGSDAIEYIEEGKSARTEDIRKRPIFRQLLADAEAGRFDCIVVHKLDRFSRNLRITLEAFERLARANVSFISITEQIDYTTPHGKLFLHMLAALAQWFSDNLSLETKKGKAERKRQGLYNGLLPFGYSKGPDGMPAPHPMNHAGLLLAFQVAAEGASDAEVARRLNAAGYRTSGNRGMNLFTKDTVRRMLQNRFYLGELPDDKGTWLKGKHQPLLDVELFERAQAARAANLKRAAKSTNSRGRVYSLSGLMVCGYCGSKIHIQRQHSDQARCICYARIQGKECQQRSVFLRYYEDQFTEWLTRIKLPDDADPKVKTTDASRNDERKRLENRLKRLLDAYTWGDLSEDEYRVARDETKRLLDTLPADQPRTDLSKLRSLISDLLWVWRHGTDEEQNVLAAQLIERIVVCDGRIVEIAPREELTELVPPASISYSGSYSGGSDGQGFDTRMLRYLAPRDNLPSAFLHVIAQTARVSSVSKTARRFGVARQTVRRAMVCLGPPLRQTVGPEGRGEKTERRLVLSPVSTETLTR